MTSRRRKSSRFSKAKNDLNKEARSMGKSLIGLTPISKAVTAYDIATGTPRLARAVSNYGNALLSDTKRKVKKRIPRNLL